MHQGRIFVFYLGGGNPKVAFGAEEAYLGAAYLGAAMDDDCGEEPHAMEHSTANAALDEEFLLSPLGGSSSRLSIETAPRTPGGVAGARGPPPACSHAAARALELGAAAGSASTAHCGAALGALERSSAGGHHETAAGESAGWGGAGASDVVKVVFPDMCRSAHGPRFHEALTRLLNGQWKAARAALAAAASARMRHAGGLPAAAPHVHCSMSSQEVKDLMLALVGVAVELQTNKVGSAKSTDLLMFVRVRRAPLEGGQSDLAVYNVVHRLLRQLNLQCCLPPGASSPDVHGQGQGSMVRQLQEAMQQHVDKRSKAPIVLKGEVGAKSVVQSLKGSKEQVPLWGAGDSCKGVIGPFLRSSTAAGAARGSQANRPA